VVDDINETAPQSQPADRKNSRLQVAPSTPPAAVVPSSPPAKEIFVTAPLSPKPLPLSLVRMWMPFVDRLQAKATNKDGKLIAIFEVMWTCSCPNYRSPYLMS
jgi:hypothetical protein